MPRTQYYNTNGGGIGYRGPSATPVQTYAFQQAPPQLRPENRSTSAPVNPYSQAQAFQPTLAPTKQGHATHPSSSSGSTASSSSSNQSSTRQRSGSKDDSAMSHQRAKSADDLSRKLSSNMDSSRAINLSTSVPDLTLTSFDTPVKTSPARYRPNRNASGPSSPSLPQESKSAAPSGSGMAGVAHLYKSNGPSPRPGHTRTTSMDDSALPRSNSETAKRYRRRSLGGFEGIASPQGSGSAVPSWTPPQQSLQDAKLGAPSSPSYSHKNASGESISSASNSTRPSSVSYELSARSFETSFS